uniref:HTH CENPB-type domain-containing protein n=1 Tax=Salarias fasciatus TaxID=181472 RepID=A0A672HC27_SALFA
MYEWQPFITLKKMAKFDINFAALPHGNRELKSYDLDNFELSTCVDGVYQISAHLEKRAIKTNILYDVLENADSAFFKIQSQIAAFLGSNAGQLNKQQRRSYDANFKLMVINAAESSNYCQAARRYGVAECRVRYWRAQKERLQNANTMRKAFRGPKSGLFREIDRRVSEYVSEKRNEGMPITRAVIQLKALEIANELKIPPTEFKASLGWCKRMMRRNGLALRRKTSLAQRLPSDFREKLLSYQRYVLGLRKKHHYPLDQMGNTDQTPKSRITVMLTCLADGTKLPLYVVLRRKTIPKEPMPPGIIVRAQEKGWMETELVVDWLKVVWGRRHGGLRKTRNMLVLDAFRGHLTEPVKKQLRSMNGDIVIIPGGMTSQLQVLDVVVNKPFKDNLRKKYTEWLLSADHALTPTGRIQKPAVRLLCEWVLQAWDAVSSESIINGFKKCCISNAMDGSEDDVLWEEVGPAEQREEDGSDESDSEPSEAEDLCE